MGNDAEKSEGRTWITAGDPEYTVGLLGVRVSQQDMDRGEWRDLRVAEIERRILAIEARLEGAQDKIGIAL